MLLNSTDHTPHLSMTEKVSRRPPPIRRALIHEWKESSRPTQREWVTSAVRREPHAPGLRTCGPVDRNSRPSGKSIWRFIANALSEHRGREISGLRRSGRMTGYTKITRLVARHKMFFGSSKSVRCGLPTIQTLSPRQGALVMVKRWNTSAEHEADYVS
jgi:hypothetical protein